MEIMIYTVQSGDSLYHIAKKYDTTVGSIAKFNGIEDPNRIQVGQILRIPINFTDSLDKMDTYVIQKGDTLYLIAKRIGSTIDELAALNGIQDVDMIYAGDILLLPKNSSDGLVEDENGTRVYTVKAGDTLYSIARRYRTTVGRLINLNRLTNPDMIYPGQTLRIS